MVKLKTSRDIAQQRKAGRVVAEALAAVKEKTEIGVTLSELDRVAAQVIEAAGATPAFLGYHPVWAPTPYPGVICASPNEAVVHGIPDGTRVGDGDLVSIDCGAFVEGWCADAAISFVVGTPRPEDIALIDATEAALKRGIEAAQPGSRLGDVGHAIGSVARKDGYGLLANHGGHGVGRAMHEDPGIANEGRPGLGYPLLPGLVIALEPMLIADGTDGYVTAADGWTICTATGARAAHSEHTIAITDDGPVILTVL